ncbi:hypothetical protein J7E73_31815 [Paenibacillus albidus]|uniref:hypothetical protein n=1 Tax=Paenibacillus albidus TaxID=2041023 RepID=UPI001BEBBB49|nr:hypothetical protein [Paenibacillus albidus]MBT2293599.1 hypothetical protein [Paenibacillus albidus]
MRGIFASLFAQAAPGRSPAVYPVSRTSGVVGNLERLKYQIQPLDFVERLGRAPDDGTQKGLQWFCEYNMEQDTLEVG